jgi:hypothetical protein
MAKATTALRSIPRDPSKRLHLALEWAMSRLSWVPPVAHVIALAISSILFALSQKPDGTYDQTMVVWGVGLVALAIALNIFIEVWRRQAKAAEAEEGGQYTMTLEHAILPISDDLGRIPTAGSADARERVFQRLVGNVPLALIKVALSSARDIRVVIYSVKSQQGMKRHLVVERSSGRKDKPRVIKDKDGGRGERIFKWLDSAPDPKFVADLNQTPPSDGNVPAAYLTFISAPIRANDKLYGMLAIDAPNVGDLDESDKPAVAVIASLLGAAYAAARP